jgi:hypothetical protein
MKFIVWFGYLFAKHTLIYKEIFVSSSSSYSYSSSSSSVAALSEEDKHLPSCSPPSILILRYLFPFNNFNIYSVILDTCIILHLSLGLP